MLLFLLHVFGGELPTTVSSCCNQENKRITIGLFGKDVPKTVRFPDFGRKQMRCRQFIQRIFWQFCKFHSLPETNMAPENGWLEYDCFLLGWHIFRGYVSFRECSTLSGIVSWFDQISNNNIQLDQRSRQWGDELCSLVHWWQGQGGEFVCRTRGKGLKEHGDDENLYQSLGKQILMIWQLLVMDYWWWWWLLLLSSFFWWFWWFWYIIYIYIYIRCLWWSWCWWWFNIFL